MDNLSHYTMDLSDRVALITGGGTGIGRASAQALARAGATVVLTGRRPAPLAEAVAAIRATGGSAYDVPADISDENDISRLIEGVLAEHGRLDIAINNAGVAAYDTIDHLGVDDFDRVFNTNVRGLWLLMKKEIEVMQAQARGGAIVNLSSIAAAGGTRLSIYGASKSAGNTMMRALALEAGHAGIRINNVSPGVTETDMIAVLDDETRAGIREHTPLGRLGHPDDVASAVLWLASDAACFVTGQDLIIDGGYSLPGLH